MPNKFPPEPETKDDLPSPTKSTLAESVLPKPVIARPTCKYGLGYLPDTHDKSKDPTSRALFGAPLRLADSASLEKYMTSIYDQGQTSSCTGWAFAQAIMLRLKVTGITIPLPSPVNIYTCGRAMLRSQSGKTPEESPLKDEGAVPSLVVAGINQWGVASNDAWPFSPDTINDEPELEDLEVASSFLLPPSQVYRINSVGEGRLLDVRQAIANGYPVAIGTAVDQAFEAYSGGKKSVTAPDPSKILGGHMMHLVGYTNDGRFRGVNQWGRSWGDGGMYWADESFITTEYMTDLYVLAAVASGH